MAKGSGGTRINSASSINSVAAQINYQMVGKMIL